MTHRLFLSALACLGLVAGSAQGSRAAYPMDDARVQREPDMEGCSRYQVRFGDDQEVARSEEQVDLPRADVDRITAQTGRGGVLVVGWNGDGYRIRACKAAGGDTLSEARAMLATMALRVDHGRLSVTEPPNNRWVVHFIVYAPQGGEVSLEATNGPLAVRSFTGTADMVSQNGPISISRASGRITARAVNGPVSVADSSGDITARTQNGPVSVSLSDGQWQGEKLEASTQNGPISVDVPVGYQSGVEVSMGRNAPFHCASDVCRSGSAQRLWNESGRRLLMGGSDLLVKVSTQNGPVTVGSPD